MFNNGGHVATANSFRRQIDGQRDSAVERKFLITADCELQRSVVVAKAFFEKIGMSPLMHKAEHIDRLALDFVVEQIGKGSASATRKTVRADVIAAFPAQHGPDGRFHPCLEIFAQAWQNLRVAPGLVPQILAEEAAENYSHAGSPKTSSNVSPLSSPDCKRVRREFSSLRISSSLRRSGEMLSSSRRARVSRSAAGRARASSAR
jgi:hypothetical protein